MNFMKLNIQLFAHVKAQGSTKNGRDSAGRRLVLKQQMVKLYCLVQFFIVKEELEIYPGTNVGIEKMIHYLLSYWCVKYERLGKNRKKVSVYEA